MFLVIAVGSWLIALIPAVQTWATSRLLLLGAPERASLTISLAVSSLALLVLWIRARISLYRCRARIRAAIRQVQTPELQPVATERPPEQVAILQYLAATNGDYFKGIAHFLEMNSEVLAYHLGELEMADLIEQESGYTGGKYKLWHDGRRYLIERGLLK